MSEYNSPQHEAKETGIFGALDPQLLDVIVKKLETAKQSIDNPGNEAPQRFCIAGYWDGTDYCGFLYTDAV